MSSEKLNGTIEINLDRRTVTIRLNDGSYVHDHYPVGIMRFLEESIRLNSKTKPY